MKINLIIWWLGAIPVMFITIPFYLLRVISEFMVEIDEKFFDWWNDKWLNNEKED